MSERAFRRRSRADDASDAAEDEEGVAAGEEAFSSV